MKQQLPVMLTGFSAQLISARSIYYVMSCRLYFQQVGLGWGVLVGANITDFVLILNTDAAVEAFSGKGQVCM